MNSLTSLSPEPTLLFNPQLLLFLSWLGWNGTGWLLSFPFLSDSSSFTPETDESDSAIGLFSLSS